MSRLHLILVLTSLIWVLGWVPVTLAGLAKILSGYVRAGIIQLSNRVPVTSPGHVWPLGRTCLAPQLNPGLRPDTGHVQCPGRVPERVVGHVQLPTQT
jgi:hypothetical protein